MRAQIEIGCREFERHFGRRPQGIWLPECGYAAGVDELLRDAGIRYFFTDTHGVLFAEPRPQVRRLRPDPLPQAAAWPRLARDTESSKQVWSAVEGYPGDYVYREFYRDVGFDLDYEYLKPHLHQTGIRSHLGIKYYKITGRTDAQAAVRPAGGAGQGGRARRQLHVQPREAGRMAGRLDGRPAVADRRPLRRRAVRPLVVRGAGLDQLPAAQDALRPADGQDDHRAGVPRPAPEDPGRPSRSMSSWGYKGYCEVWLEGSNDWIYRHLHEVADRMVELARANPDADAAAAAGAEPGGPRAAAGAVERLGVHHEDRHDGRVRPRADAASTCSTSTTSTSRSSATTIDEPWLGEIERRHNLFPDIDYRVYA